MEPMLVGSPTNSTSPQMGRGGVAYLPSFLTGDSFIASPQIQSYGGNFFGGSQPNRVPLNDRSINFAHSTTIGRNESFSRQVNKSKITGPPIQSLQDNMLIGNSSFAKSNLNDMNPNQSINPSKDFGESKYVSASPFETTNQSFYTEDNGIASDATWVTIFGYNTSHTALVLDDFREYGVIVKYIIHPTGNWMHIKYRSALQVRHALSKNGRIFNSNYMIGVKLCTEKEILDYDKENPKLFDSSLISAEDQSNFSAKMNPNVTLNGDRNLSIHTDGDSIQIPEKSRGIFERFSFWNK